MEDNSSVNGGKGWGMVWVGDVSGSNGSDGGAMGSSWEWLMEFTSLCHSPPAGWPGS